MRRTLLLLLAGSLLAGCGSDRGLDFSLRTPPPYIGGVPVAPPRQQAVDRKMTRSDAERVKPVIADWAAAVRAEDFAKAAGYFDLPAVVFQPTNRALEVNTPHIAQAFNAGLPCGAKLLATNPDGRYVVGTFVLVPHGGTPCTAKNKVAKVGFVFGDKRHPKQFTEWWQVSDTPDSPTGPASRPKTVAPATVSDFG